MGTRKSHKAELVLRYISDIGYTNQLALSILVSDNIKKPRGHEGEAYRLLKHLLRAKLIKPIPDLYGKDYHSKYRFYQPTKKAFDLYDLTKRKKERKHPKDEQHEQMRIDILTALYKAYHKDYEIEIEYKVLKHPVEPYKPDAIIKLTPKNTGHTRCFILEVETGTRSVENIRKLKIDMMEQLNFKEADLPKESRFLVVYAHNQWNKFWRAIEFPNVKTQTDQNLKKLINASRYKRGRFLFMPLYKYPSIYENPNSACCFNSQGIPTSLTKN